MRSIGAGGLIAVGLPAACGTAGPDELGAGGGESGQVLSLVSTTAASETSESQMTPGLQAAYVLARQREAGPAYAVETESLTARNDAQGMRLSFSSSGIDVKPEGDAWSLRLGIDSFGCVGAMSDLAQGTPEVDKAQPNRVVQDHGELTAWYLNGPLGLEQGFEIDEAPACASHGPLRIAMGIDGLSPTLGKRGEVVLRDEGRRAMQVDGLYVTDARGHELGAELSVDSGAVVIEVDTRGAVFPVGVDPLWSLQQILTASDAGFGDSFGRSVSLSGDTAVVGSVGNESIVGSGSVYVFVRNGGVWAQQQELIASDASTSDGFGVSVSVAGDTVLVGAYGDFINEVGAGAAYVFERSGGIWTEQQKLVASDGVDGDAFGVSVSMSGDSAVVGAFRDDDGGNNAGSAYVFSRTGGVWSEQQKLTASDASATAGFGYSAAISGQTLVVGAYGDSGAAIAGGGAYFFDNIGGNWVQQQKVVGVDTGQLDYFGESVSISGDSALIGATGHNNFAGAGYVFVRNGGTWAQDQKLTPSVSSPWDFFGRAVSLSGNAAVVGAHAGDQAYFFVKNAGVWTELQGLAPPGVQAFDHFGFSVSIDGDSLLVGSVDDDHVVNGAGSAYVFELSNLGDPCSIDGQCDSGFCVDGVCCNAICGAGDTTDCQSCIAAETGGTDGVCTPILGGVVCRGSSAACDAPESCDGVSTDCPVDLLAASGTPCGDPTNNACNAPDVCDGAGSCLDNFIAAGAPCGDQGAACAIDDACDGLGSRTDNGFLPSTTICRDSLGACDPAESCTGADADCPADELEPAGAECRAAAGECDAAETCDGLNPACPADVVSVAGTACREALDVCDIEEQCDGAHRDCPADLTVADGTACDDANACTNADACVAGACEGDNICGAGGEAGSGGGGLPDGVDATSDADDGCSCRLVGSTPAPAPLAFLLAIGAALRRHRRR